jgi:imidazolonepropionase
LTRTLIHDIGDLVTLAPLARVGRAAVPSEESLGRERGAWLLLEKGRVAAHGTGKRPPLGSADVTIDAKGGLVMPGLVDCHTHAIYGGSRAAEFMQRLAGVTYQEIAAAGGGIQSTVKATRAASDDELLEGMAERLARWLAQGVTTVEVKSGYGLTVKDELRLLRIVKRARAAATTGGKTPGGRAIHQEIAATCLALHAASDAHPSLADYVAACTTDLLPVVKADGLATWVDAFVETGYFSVQDVEPFIVKAKELGLGVRLHADEFSDAGAAAAAARWGAVAADHLQCASEAGVAAMAKAGVIATLLPGTSLYTRLPFTDGRRYARAGVPVAIASDFNPGSCQIDNLPMLAAVAAVQCGVSPAEAVAGVTLNAAWSLGLGARKGALTTGYDADVVLYELPDVAAWLADFGRTKPRAVWSRGAAVVGR